MVNSKKNSKSLIALVVMAFLLVASIVLAATGAWFTHNVSDQTDSLTFGNITIAVKGTSEFTATHKDGSAVSYADADIMPGDKINFTSTIENQGEAAYLFVKYEVEGLADGATAPTITLGGEGLVLVEDSSDTYYVAVDATAEKAFSFAATLDGDKYPDDPYENATITITVKFAAVQQANLTAKEALAVAVWNAGV